MKITTFKFASVGAAVLLTVGSIESFAAPKGRMPTPPARFAPPLAKLPPQVRPPIGIVPPQVRPPMVKAPPHVMPFLTLAPPASIAPPMATNPPTVIPPIGGSPRTNMPTVPHVEVKLEESRAVRGDSAAGQAPTVEISADMSERAPGVTLAGGWLYKSNGLEFRLDLNQKMKVTEGRFASSAEVLNGQFDAIITADCKVNGDAKNLSSSSARGNEIEFSNFFGPAIGTCTQAERVVAALHRVRSFSLKADGTLTLNLHGGTTLKLKQAPRNDVGL